MNHFWRITFSFPVPATAIPFAVLVFLLLSCPAPPSIAQESILPTPNENKYSDWTILRVPGTWDEQSGGDLAAYDGFAWYRCGLTIPKSWKGNPCTLEIANIDNAYEVFFNGRRCGGGGSFPPDYKNGLDETIKFSLTAEDLKFGDGANTVSLRVYDHDGRGGFKTIAPVIFSGKNGIAMNGRWEFRIGDDVQWAKQKVQRTDAGIFYREMSLREARARASGSDPALEPREAMNSFSVADDIRMSLVLAEPEITQPVFFNFDQRGRMWVMNYNQYPNPAGLKMLSRDDYWRSVYDKVPQAPPNHIRGADKITIHKDTNQDGKYDQHKTFVDGLSIASSFVQGRGGVWVLNPPYLLFYADANQDDVPDGDPVVHLSGFGIEDTHSVVNSLCWGPDGWLYGAQGSTVTGNVRVEQPHDDESAANVHRSLGQLIWRYQPEHRIYEVYAEGGGNAFGVEMDSQGRIFSGHNGGDTRGFHYVQGGYYKKGFGKHGPLSNPFAFGYFEPMSHHSAARFTHAFVIYEGGLFPEKYSGQLFGVEPMQGRIVRSEVSQEGSSFQTKDLDRPVISDDSRFRPVDIKVGPDGAIYFADFYEPQISHREHFAGQVEKDNGRIYRLTPKLSTPPQPIDLAKMTVSQLIDQLTHENRWIRKTTLRLLHDAAYANAEIDPELIQGLKDRLFETKGQLALESLWALHALEAFDLTVAETALRHPDPQVQTWTARLIGDRSVYDSEFVTTLNAPLVNCCKNATNKFLRSQLASTAKRTDAETCMKMVTGLLASQQSKDIHLPLLLWWAIESCCDDGEVVLNAIESKAWLWEGELFRDQLSGRLMRRFAMTEKRRDLEHCATLLQMAPDDKSRKILLAGFEQAFQGRSLAQLPQSLEDALAAAGGGSLLLRVRRGDESAVAEARKLLVQPELESSETLSIIRTLGEVRTNSALPELLNIFDTSKDAATIATVLVSLQNFPDESIGQRIARRFSDLPTESQLDAASVLATRKAWSKSMLAAIENGTIDSNAIPEDTVRKLLVHADTEVNALVAKHWPELKYATSQELQKQIASYSEQLQGKSGDPYAGKVLYSNSCAKCHQMFGNGGNIGPDLTTFNRDDTLAMLINIVDPSAEIREGFENFTILTDDGRVLTGFVADKDNQVLVIRTAEGQTITIPQDEIEGMKANNKSMMPEGLLDDLSDAQISDLFAYLRSSQPINN